MQSNFNIDCKSHSKNANSLLTPKQRSGPIFNICGPSFPNYNSAMNQKKRCFSTQTEVHEEVKPRTSSRNRRSTRPTIFQDFLRNVISKIIAPSVPLPHLTTQLHSGLEKRIGLTPCLFQSTIETKDNIKNFIESNSFEDMADINSPKKRGRNRRRNRRNRKISNSVTCIEENNNKIHHNLRKLQKNMHAKERLAIEKDINEDFCGASSTETNHNKEEESNLMHHIGEGFAIVTLQETFSTEHENKKLFSSEDFPPISQSYSVPDSRMRICCSHQSPLSQSLSQPYYATEDDFIIFRHDTPKLTPSAVTKPSNLCGKINEILTATSPIASLKMSFQKSADCVFPPKRDRLMSECSDDSFVVFFDPDCPTTSANLVDDFESDCDESDSEDSSKDECSENEKSTKSSTEDLHQPDSGFEEKKVIIFFYDCLRFYLLKCFSFRFDST